MFSELNRQLAEARQGNSRDSVARARGQVSAALERLGEMEALERKALDQLNHQIYALIVES